ncbi:replication initiation factor domain-containing protein [Propionivibrio soli]|uniref:replication initiation factor domain-containing protein n=1 Tax=Propionivibrio soli TaxID=2976531 RepID=UPI0021E92A77|nr:replication initiation factor domain-containing protein [Propionivibrio soli]
MTKRAPEAPSLETMRLSEAQLAEIYQDVKRGLAQAEANLRFHASARRPERSEDARGRMASPATNRGVKSGQPRQVIAAKLRLEDGQVIEIPARRTWGGSAAFLDWVNFTTDERDFFFGKACVTDEEVMDRVSYKLKEIFGFGITKQRDGGANFYDRSYIIGDGYGLVCYGGQRNTILIMLSGEGCAAARDGWEKRLYHFLTTACSHRAKLTRVDCAHDDYKGESYSVTQADADFDAGKFNTGGRNPNHEYRGNWKRPTGKGRTLYIGNRESGKFCRVYEKGRQLGDRTSEWVRVEVEFKAIHRFIPFEILLQPGQFLAAAYPAFAWISQRQERILTTQKKTEITYQSACENGRKQLGALINVMLAIEGTAEKVVQKLIRDAIPARLKVPMWRTVGECIHEYQREQCPREVFDNMALA